VQCIILRTGGALLLKVTLEGRVKSEEQSLTLAPGVEFDPIYHFYFYKGKRIHGVTSAIGKRHGITPKATQYMESARAEGSFIHEEVSRWINDGRMPINPSVQWVAQYFAKKNRKRKLHSEILITDFKGTASAIDIVEQEDNLLWLYDIKTGVFKRGYTTEQLSIYKFMVEMFAPGRFIVKGLYCLSTKDRYCYPIIPEDGKSLLYGGTSNGKG